MAMDTRRELEALIEEDIQRDYWENQKHEIIYIESRIEASMLEGIE